MKPAMSGSERITLSIPREIAERLDELAAQTRESRASLARRLLAESLEKERWRLRSVREGIADLDAGRTVSDEAVEAWLASWGTNEERPAPK